jgi:hypothetical protein
MSGSDNDLGKAFLIAGLFSVAFDSEKDVGKTQYGLVPIPIALQFADELHP